TTVASRVQSSPTPTVITIGNQTTVHSDSRSEDEPVRKRQKVWHAPPPPASSKRSQQQTNAGFISALRKFKAGSSQLENSKDDEDVQDEIFSSEEEEEEEEEEEDAPKSEKTSNGPKENVQKAAEKDEEAITVGEDVIRELEMCSTAPCALQQEPP